MLWMQLQLMMLLSTYLFKSQVRCSFAPSKPWYHPSPNVDASYGVVFKCVKIFSRLPERSNSSLTIEDVAAHFAESESESETQILVCRGRF